MRFLPEIILSVAGTLLMMLDAATSGRQPKIYGHLTIAAFVAALFATVAAGADPGFSFSSMVVVDGFGTFFRLLVLTVGILAVLASYRYLEREKAETGEYHALLIFCVTGQLIMVTANDLMMVFIGLLAGYLRDDKRNNEAALKYFLLGSFATAFLLYGVALIYGLTGSTRLDTIQLAVAHPGVSLGFVSIAAALMFVGLAFKVSAAPFQVWAPDVYQGSPAPVSAFMSAGPKAAAFAIFLRIFMTAFLPVARGWEPLIWMAALLSMTIGNFGALTQNNLKRMLAYSSIAHAGYVLVALASASSTGTAAAMFYLAGYALMNIGAFAVVIHIAGKGEKNLRIEDLSGLARVQPMTAIFLTIFLLSLIGVPLTAGFFGKLYVFKAALQSKLVWLAILGLLNSAVAAYYYLRLIFLMYMAEPSEAVKKAEPVGFGLQAALALPAAGTFFLGILPSSVLDFVLRSSNFGR
jgi:NADH-quinone oxidoreductase subunit N